MTPEQYTETLALIAMRLTAAVRDEGPQEVAEAIAAAHALPPPPGIDPTVAFAVTLAAAIPTDRTRTQLWGWTLGIPNGTYTTIPTGAAANRFATEMALAGHLTLDALTDDEATTVITILTERDWPLNAIAAHLDTEPATIHRIRKASTRRHNPARREDAA